MLRILLMVLFFGFISCQNKKEKEVIEEDDSLVVSALPLDIPFPENNPHSKENADLGKLLFFDPILSGNKDVACATCHHPEFGFAENLEISIGVNGHGFGSKRQFNSPNEIPFVKRNSQAIVNVAFNGFNSESEVNPNSAPMFWDLRAESLEKQALEPIKTMEEMRGKSIEEHEILDLVVKRIKLIKEYNMLFEKAFGKNAVNIDNLSKAIATYERTIVANNSRFDKYMRGDATALSYNEIEGMKAFRKAGCINCHNGPMFSDFKQHVLAPKANEKLTFFDDGINKTNGFRTPSLRNLRLTAPYMHSGKLKTLTNVLEFYED
ncbi:cytochrome-c peroxidase, partial [Lacihabitans sp. LS3-19]